MDGKACKNAEDTEKLLRNHLALLRADPFLKEAWIILIYEKGTGHESGHHWKIVNEHQYQPAYAIYDKVVDLEQAKNTIEADPGVRLDNYRKNQYGKTLSDALRYHKIYIYNWLVVGNLSVPNYDNRISYMKRILCRQLNQCKYKFTDIDPDNVELSNSRTRTWNGKMNEFGKVVPGQNDDVVMSLAQGLYYATLIERGELPGFPYNKIFPNGPPQLPISTMA